MTTGYVVQIDLPKGTRYLGQAGKIGLVPKFFLSFPTVRSYLQQKSHYGDDHYDASRHSPITKVVTIRDLEKGLKDSKAEVSFYTEFLTKTAPQRDRAKSNPNAVYKLRRADGSWVTFGKPKPKHGKIWNRAGDLRSHITSFGPQSLHGTYSGAEVVEIIMSGDGIIPATVNVIPVLKFYTDSPECRKKYEVTLRPMDNRWINSVTLSQMETV